MEFVNSMTTWYSFVVKDVLLPFGLIKIILETCFDPTNSSLVYVFVNNLFKVSTKICWFESYEMMIFDVDSIPKITFNSEVDSNFWL